MYITQLRIRAARVQITSALLPQNTHWQQTAQLQRSTKKRKMAQTRLELLWSDQLLTTSCIRSERDFNMIRRQNETSSYLVYVNQEVRQGLSQWAQTGKTCYQFFKMQGTTEAQSFTLSLKASILAAGVPSAVEKSDSWQGSEDCRIYKSTALWSTLWEKSYIRSPHTLYP